MIAAIADDVAYAANNAVGAFPLEAWRRAADADALAVVVGEQNRIDRDTSPPGLAHFSEAARAVVNCAEQEARSNGSSAIGTEHILIGVYLEGTSRAAERCPYRAVG